MRKAQFKSVDNPVMVDTNMLQSYLSCGRITAEKLGEEANAQVKLGKRVLWNIEKIKQYVNSISA